MKTSLGFANEKPPKKESRVKSLTIPSFQIEGKKREKIISCSDFAWLFEAERSGTEKQQTYNSAQISEMALL